MEETKGCPEHHRPIDTAGTAEASGCPAHVHGVRSEPQASASTEVSQQTMAAQPEQDEEEAKPMKCPLGFSSDNTAKLDPLSCVLCRTLMHEAVQTACGHRFCAHCIGPFRDCPLCGADCQPTSEDADMQATVDKYIDVHSRDHKLVGSDKVTPQDADTATEHPDSARAAFFLQLGLRAFAGGNPASALARLRRCEAALLVMQKAEPNSAGVATQLGAVSGCQGDALRKLDDAEGATAMYGESVRHLRSCTAQSHEVQHALSVTFNKLGDLRYMQGDLAAARQQYSQSLDIRRAICGHSGSSGGDADGQSGVDLLQQLDLAASLVKVADVSSAMGDAQAAARMNSDARQIMDEAPADGEGLDKAVQGKLQGLRAYFAAADAQNGS